MDYEKKIRDYMYSSEVDKLYKSMLSNLFPELVEPKEEKARRSLLEFLEDLFKLGKNINFDRWSKADCEEWVNWVMKQGEQKPANKVEPKFKVGDWIVTNKKHIWLVDEDCSTTGYLYRLVAINGKVEVAEFEIVDKKARLWTIQDAKEGDVLADGNLPFIFKKIDTNRYSYAYCGISAHNDFKIKADGKSDEWTWMQDIKPATKEQRELLFQKMKEAGYEWDADKKELKKIEQKPTDLRTKAGNWYICDMEVMNENMGPVFRRGEIYYCPKDGYLDVSGALFEVGGLDVFRLATEKEIPQPKQEWSEEDENQRINTIGLVKNANDCAGILDKETALNWLKSLKDRYAWKPSEEQMTQLKRYCPDNRPLTSLYEQLKKLKV